MRTTFAILLSIFFSPFGARAAGSPEVTYHCRTDLRSLREDLLVEAIRGVSDFQKRAREQGAAKKSMQTASLLVIRAAFIASDYPLRRFKWTVRYEPSTNLINTSGSFESPDPSANELGSELLAPVVRKLKQLRSYQQLLLGMEKGQATRGHLRAFMSDATAVIKTADPVVFERVAPEHRFRNELEERRSSFDESALRGLKLAGPRGAAESLLLYGPERASIVHGQSVLCERR